MLTLAGHAISFITLGLSLSTVSVMPLFTKLAE